MWAGCVQFLRNCTAERSRQNTTRKVKPCRYAQSQLQQLSAAEPLQYDRISHGCSISIVEASIGKPVISSNFAMAWHAFRLAGAEDREPHRGRLFAL